MSTQLILPRADIKTDDQIVVWFSCGAASAVAAKLTLDEFGSDRVRIVNQPIVEEDEDNRRFLFDVQDWLGKTIETVTHPKYPKMSAREVWSDVKAMSFPKGAPCTKILKKECRQWFENSNQIDWHVFGFTSDERKRHSSFTLTERSNVIPVLITHRVTKEDCARLIIDAGIDLPISYRQGYPNANCKGCVKATSPTYWNLLRKTDPDVFWDRARQSRELGVRLVRVKGVRIFLDELDPDVIGRPLKSMPECGFNCEEIK